MQKIIYFKLINKNNNNHFVNLFEIDKIKELISQKYYWSSLKKAIKAQDKSYDICLPLKIVKYKSLIDLQLMLILIYY